MCFLLKTLLWTFLACTTDLRTKTWSKSLPTDHNNKKGSCLGKLCSWEDTMVGIILASTSNVSQGKNYLAQWCLKYFVELNKTRISKQAEGTLASLPGEWKECWEWTAVDLGEKNQECVYVRAQLWTSVKHLSKIHKINAQNIMKAKFCCQNCWRYSRVKY